MTKAAADRTFIVLWREQLRDSDANWAMKYVGLTMSLRMGTAGRGYDASLDTTVEETGLSESTVRRARRELVKHQWLTVTPGGGRGNTNRYTAKKPGQSKGVLDEKGCQSKGVPEPETVSQETGSGAKGVQNGAERVSERLVKGVSLTPEVVTAEIESEVGTTAALRRRDEIWDAVMESCGVATDEITESKRKGYGRAVADLKRVGATPQKIRDRAAEYQRRFPQAALTPNALSNHWAELGRRPPAMNTNTVDGAAAWLEAKGIPT